MHRMTFRRENCDSLRNLDKSAKVFDINFHSSKSKMISLIQQPTHPLRAIMEQVDKFTYLSNCFRFGISGEHELSLPIQTMQLRSPFG